MNNIWAVLGLLLTNALALFSGFRYLIGRIEEIDKQHDIKEARIFARLDEVKDGIDNKFVLKENCSILHKNTADNLVGSENRTVIRIDRLEVKVETMMSEILRILRK